MSSSSLTSATASASFLPSVTANASFGFVARSSIKSDSAPSSSRFVGGCGGVVPKLQLSKVQSQQVYEGSQTGRISEGNGLASRQVTARHPDDSQKTQRLFVQPKTSSTSSSHARATVSFLYAPIKPCKVLSEKELLDCYPAAPGEHYIEIADDEDEELVEEEELVVEEFEEPSLPPAQTARETDVTKVEQVQPTSQRT